MVTEFVLWEILSRKGTPRHITQLIKSLYKETLIFIDTGSEVGNEQRSRVFDKDANCQQSYSVFVLGRVKDEWSRQAPTGIRILKNVCIKMYYFPMANEVSQEQKMNYNTKYIN
jgi:hypothetical protein